MERMAEGGRSQSAAGAEWRSSGLFRRTPRAVSDQRTLENWRGSGLPPGNRCRFVNGVLDQRATGTQKAGLGIRLNFVNPVF